MELEQTFCRFEAFISIIAVSLCLYALVLTLYRLVLHPLARVPGPIYQKVSGLPRMRQCYNGDRYLHETAGHKKYGGVIRIAPNALSFNTTSAFQAIYGKDANAFKGDELYGVLDGGPHGAKSMQMLRDNEAHATRRRIFNRALPKRAQAFSMINDLAQTLIDIVDQYGGLSRDDSGIENGWSQPVDISLLTRWYSFDVISKIGFGQSLNLMTSDETRWMPHALERSSVLFYWVGFEPHVKFWRWFLNTDLPRRLGLSDAVEAQRWMSFISELFIKRKADVNIDAEKAGAGGSQDIFRHLLKANLVSDMDLQADSSLLVAAGSDGNRLTVVAALHYLLQDPAALKKVTEEIRGAVSSPDDISDLALSSMRFLRACVDETLRLTPPKPASIPREVGKGGTTIDGMCIPEGTSVGVSIYSLHHNPEIYPDPYAFNPERWLSIGDDRTMQAAFSPFLKGPRMCPGGPIAYTTIQLALFHLLHRYDIRFAPGMPNQTGIDTHSKLRQRPGELQMNDWIIGFVGDLPIQLRPHMKM